MLFSLKSNVNWLNSFFFLILFPGKNFDERWSFSSFIIPSLFFFIFLRLHSFLLSCKGLMWTGLFAQLSQHRAFSSQEKTLCRYNFGIQNKNIKCSSSVSCCRTRESLLLLSREGGSEKFPAVYLTLDDRTWLTHRMDGRTSYWGSKVGGSGCLIRFKLVSGSALLIHF